MLGCSGSVVCFKRFGGRGAEWRKALISFFPTINKGVIVCRVIFTQLYTHLKHTRLGHTEETFLLLLWQVAERRRLCLPSRARASLMRWRAPAPRGPSSRAPATTGAVAPGAPTGTGVAAATTWTLEGCSAASLWMPARGAGTCATSLICTTTRPGDW